MEIWQCLGRVRKPDDGPNGRDGLEVGVMKTQRFTWWGTLKNGALKLGVRPPAELDMVLDAFIAFPAGRTDTNSTGSTRSSIASATKWRTTFAA